MGTEKRRILVTGAVGQIGSELTPELRRIHGTDAVVAAGHRTKPKADLRDSGPFTTVNVTDPEAVAQVVRDYEIGTVYHLGALLSAVGEQHPQRCWDVNVNGLLSFLEVAREQGIRLFCPSSIAVFGPGAPQDQTPQETVLRPTSMYGVTKVAGELLCDYYVQRFGVDVRGVRYPGLISSETLPGGGTTDYAVEIYYEALRHGRYTCFVREDTVLPMMYMPDAIRAAIELMEAPAERLIHHADFNLAAMSFSAGEVAAAIRSEIPGFECSYEPDSRQAIADSWPRSIDDQAARQEWGWKPAYDLDRMTTDMLSRLRQRQEAGQL